MFSNKDKIYVDFNNADKNGLIRLNTIGTSEDIISKNIILAPGLKLLLDDNEGIIIEGTVDFSEEEQIWVAKINRNEFTFHDE